MAPESNARRTEDHASSEMLVQLTAEELAQMVRRAVAAELDARGVSAAAPVFLTRPQAAKLLNCSERTVLRLIKDGLPAEKLGVEWRFEQAKVVEFMRAHERKAG